MSFWRWLLGDDEPEKKTNVQVSDGPAIAPPIMPEAVSLDVALMRAAGTVDERAVLERVRREALQGTASENARLRAAELLMARGEAAIASEMLEGTTSVAGRLLAAEALAERHLPEEAAEILERVLAKDIDAAGVLERVRRLRAQLGVSPTASGGRDEATVMAAMEQKTPFRIVGEIGRGGSATVYRAEDDLLTRTVALKLYHQPKEARDQIEREARLAVKLGGTGVVRVFDVDLDAGWIAFEHAGRGALREALARGDRDVIDGRNRWVPMLAKTLARVHAAGFVHGDVKPANVLFRSTASSLLAPLLSDFGLATAIGEQMSGGTVGFLAPERIAGAPASPADDVFALGKIIEASAKDERSLAFAARCVGPAASRPSAEDVAAALDFLGPLGIDATFPKTKLRAPCRRRTATSSPTSKRR